MGHPRIVPSVQDVRLLSGERTDSHDTARITGHGGRSRGFESRSPDAFSVRGNLGEGTGFRIE
jgi:hypothetical protein